LCRPGEIDIHIDVQQSGVLSPATKWNLGIYGVRFAGLWIRFGARVIDGLILGVLVASIGEVLALVFVGLIAIAEEASLGSSGLSPILRFLAIFVIWAFIVDGIYETLFIAIKGATPGKMALGLRVVRADGSPVGLIRAVCRFLAFWILGGLTLNLSCLTAALSNEKCALHDLVCGTRVIYVGPAV
jgi:uncharacterized RDD family membrane protein YckC